MCTPWRSLYKQMNRNISFKILLCWLFIVFSFGWLFNHPSQTITNSAQNVQWFDQILDHYDYLSSVYWKQRYYVIDTYFNPNNGPVLLYICGQGICNGVSNQSWTAEIARQTNGLIIALEHRFYGQSLPFRNESFSFSNIKYLTSEQALRDIAYFMDQIKENKMYGITGTNKWITIGGSYPGALSAWFRAKYPHLTVGALASSAVVLAVQSFEQFDQQIYLSAMKSGQACVDAIRQLTDYAQEQSLGPDRLTFQGLYGADKLTTREFMFYWSDVLVFQIQYGRREQFCDEVMGKSLEEMLTIVKSLYSAVSPVDYGSYYLGNASFAASDGRGGRSWYYQSCTQFSYFQPFSPLHPMRSKLLTIDFYRKWCEDIYGPSVWPFVSRTNNEFGGLALLATNLYMTNGDEDPWKWASLQTSNKAIISKTANCTNCAHCVDLRAPNEKTDSKQLTAIRASELSAIKSWISG